MQYSSRIEYESDERHLPFDGVLKPAFLFLHFVSFSIITGEFYLDKEPALAFSFLAVFSGCFLIVRELYEEGLVWFLKTEGLLTLAKLVLLSVIVLSGAFQFAGLILAILLGTTTSHLPRRIKKRIWLRRRK